ncbi:MAG: chitin deacetylase, partial [Bacteroidetes bacterium]|nr:chitin deacetylase [Bacteroidota bacterium]
DDAYLSVYTEAWPRLKEKGLPFTLFVATDPVDRDQRGYMSWAQIRELQNAGVEIGSQTASHPHMYRLDAAENAAELAKSNDRFLAEIGIRPGLFAYPYGEYTPEIRDLMREMGFSAAFGQHSGVMHQTQNPFEFPRFAFNENYGDLNRIKDASIVLPFEDITISPSDPLMSVPTDRFVIDSVNGVEGINCYISDFQGSIDKTIATIENKMLIQLERVPVQGRLRFNCTKVKKGIYWYGFQYYLP